MTIQEQNIQFVQSQVMDDVPEGGGAATGNVIVDGAANNIFEDISDLDRALGRFNLRKIFLAVRSLSTDQFGGAKTVVTQLPTDPDVSYVLFSQGDPFDRRSEIQGRVEAYLFKGPTWPGYLYANHIAGATFINVIQRVGSALPPIGKTLCLVQDEGLSGEIEQYVRVIDVSVSEQTFTEENIDFERWIVTMTLTGPLVHNFAGHEPPRLNDTAYSYTGKTRIRDTSVADAQRYYGAQPLAQPAEIGDREVRAQSQFTRLVPAAEIETPLTARPIIPTAQPTVVAGTREVSVTQAAHTDGTQVTPENRALNWQRFLIPAPSRGSVSVSFMSQGNWFVLSDDGNGNISGTDPAFGVGTIQYTTGTVSVTLGALPDVGSYVLYAWGTGSHYQQDTTASPIDPDYRVLTEEAEFVLPFPSGWGVQLHTVAISVGGAALTPGDYVGTGYRRLFAGTGVSGWAQSWSPAGSGEAHLLWDNLPPAGSTPVVVSFDRRAVRSTSTQVETTTAKAEPLSMAMGGPIPGGLALTGTLSEIPDPGSLIIRGVWLVSNFALVLRLDIEERANGELWTIAQQRADNIIAGDTPYAAESIVVATHVGSVNHSTGAINLTTLPTISRRVWDFNLGQWEENTGTALWFDGYGVALAVPSAQYTFAESRTIEGFEQITVSETITTTVGAHLRAAIARRVTSSPYPVVPNSVRLRFGSATVDDNGDGLLVRAGTVIGSINYKTGYYEITNVTGLGNPYEVTSCLVRIGRAPIEKTIFNTAAVPIKPGSFQVLGDTITGDLITAGSNEDGDITGSDATGSINYSFGVVELEFNELVDAFSLIYNAVSYRYIPLPADILGVDTVRLPSDGRVPIYRAGNVVMIMHPTTTAPVTPTQGVPVSLGRTRIAWVRVFDSAGATVSEGYELDRAAGTVTFTTVPANTPVTIRHTVADLRLVTDAQINGSLTLARPVSHNYPADESIVASCLLHGDRRARVSHVWDQVSWDGTWVDNLVGSEATATLNTIAYPIVVTNEGAETERWVLRWTNTSNVELIGQRVGLVYSGPFTANIAPINPRTRNPDGSGGTPYLTIPVAANAGGWATGNVVRINTVGAIADIWIARSIAQSDEPEGAGCDSVELYALGNIDRPGEEC